MFQLTYATIHHLVSAIGLFADEKTGLDAIRVLLGDETNPEVAGWILQEYRAHTRIWAAIHLTLQRAIEWKELKTAEEESSVWAIYDSAARQARRGTAFIDWQPTYTERIGSDDREIGSLCLKERIAKLGQVPTTPVIPGIVRRYEPSIDRMIVDILLEDLSPKGLAVALAKLVDVTADMQAMLTIRPVSEEALASVQRVATGDTSMYFMFRFLMGSEVIDERRFFSLVCTDSVHDAQVAQFIENVDQEVIEVRNGRGSGFLERFQNENMSPGGYAIAGLALREKVHIKRFAQHIEIWDMDHESWQAWAIDRVLQTHGPCFETAELLAARMGRGTGPFSPENMKRAFHVLGYCAWLREADRLGTFIARAVAPMRADVQHGHDPHRAWLDFDWRCRNAANAWSRGDIVAFREFIVCARQVLGPDLQHFPEWDERVSFEESGGTLWVPKAEEWAGDYGHFWLTLQMPEAELIAMQ